MIKKGNGIDPRTQENKAVNIKLASSKITGIIIKPGETFSFWRTIGIVNKRKGYKVVVPFMSKPICVHDDGLILNLINYDENRKKFLKEYMENE